MKKPAIQPETIWNSVFAAVASDDVLSRYDSVKDVRLHSRYRNESYKHILVPVYSTSYYYEGKLYQVAINGQTGNIHGAYPKSPVNIAAIIIAILLVLAAIFLGGGSDDSSYGRTTEYEQTDTGIRIYILFIRKEC